MESNLAAAPQLDIISSRKERTGAHIGSAYVDAANQARMTQYNNEYNYWLWKQQAEYNSPLEQRRRLEAAGLNPNFNSVDSGNLGSMPASSGSISPSVGKNSAAAVQNGINTFNALVKSIGEGVSDVSKLSGIPDDIAGYRKLLSSYMWNKVGSSATEKMLRDIEAVFKARSELGIDLGWQFGKTLPDGSIDPVSPDWENSPLFRNMGLKNQDLDWLVKLRQYDFENMKPEELELVRKRTKQVGEAAGLTANQNEVFTAMTATKVGAALGPLLLGIIKLLL